MNFDRGNNILFIDDILVFGKENPSFGAEVANMLRLPVENGKVQIFSTSTTEMFNYNISSDTQLKNRFQKIQFLDGADEANPKLIPNMVEMILTNTAQPLAGFNHFEQGAGELNVEGVVRLAKLVRQDLTNNTTLGTPMLTTTQFLFKLQSLQIKP